MDTNNEIDILCNYKYTYKKSRSYSDILMLFEYISSAYNSLKKKSLKFNTINFKINKIYNLSEIPKSSIHNSHFFPKEIQKFIDNEATYYINVKFKIKKRSVNIFFIICKEFSNKYLLKIQNYINMIYIWLFILDIFSYDKCTNHLDLFLYLTPFKKLLPNNQFVTIDSEHVNSAFTTGCKENTEIVIYREEEWYKVFIHETFHNFGLDFSDMNLYHVNQKLKNIFNLNIEYNLYESYCETWARIIYTMINTFLSLNSQDKKDFTTFNIAFLTNMEDECLHSLVQMLKILDFMDLNYKLITEKNENNITICNHLYKENTSVFSYYIITGLLINNYHNFLSWCSKNNNLLLRFKKTPGNLESYIELINKSSKNNFILKNIKCIEKFLKKNNISNTLRMTSNVIIDNKN